MVVWAVGLFLIMGMISAEASEGEKETKGTVTSAPIETWRNSDGDRKRGCSPSGVVVAEGDETYEWVRHMHTSPRQPQ